MALDQAVISLRTASLTSGSSPGSAHRAARDAAVLAVRRHPTMVRALAEGCWAATDVALFHATEAGGELVTEAWDWYRELTDTEQTAGWAVGLDVNIAFLDAMAAVKQGDPAEVAVLTAIKQTAKGTIGKMRERPRGHGYKPGERWAALDRPTWDPLMRALVIDTATVNLHRKLRKMAGDTGLYAFAVLSDCAVFAAPGPGALDVLTKPDGTLTTSLRLGVSPGMVKFEGSRPMAEVTELIADGANPARHMKAGGQVSADE